MTGSTNITISVISSSITDEVFTKAVRRYFALDAFTEDR